MAAIKKMLTNTRVLILIACLIFGFFAINPDPFATGVVIKAVQKNSSAALAGIEQPDAKIAVTKHEHITSINNKPIETPEDYYSIISALKPEQSVSIKTTKGRYTLLARPLTATTVLDENETILINETYEANETIDNKTVLVNKTRTKKVTQAKTETKIIGIEPIGLTVAQAPTSNLKKGLDLQGGTRVVLKPEGDVTPELIEEVIDALKERLNVYGLADVVVNSVSSSPEFLGGKSERYIVVEVAGATEEEVEDMVSTYGKFEAKIANQTVFVGGRDITYVCKSAQCSGIDPNRGCGRTETGYACGFQFSITLSPDAAQRQSDLTSTLTVEGDTLSEPLILYLDDQEVDSLNIAADLRGRAITDIAITGGGEGKNEQQAIDNTLANMKRLQTILKTGSLPVKLNVERIDTISPILGSEFLKNAFTAGLLSLLGVSIVLVIAYRRLLIALPIMFTALSEIFLTLAMASIIGWNIDLAAIAGIILAVGMGVNDQIIITDEAIRKQTEHAHNWKERIKRAFFIIMSAYFTQLVAMVPLFFAGAGLLKGFAVTTILAISVGVFITRPAYAAIVQNLVEE